MIGTMLGGAVALVAAPAVGGLAWRTSSSERSSASGMQARIVGPAIL
jgi:hypothetical protein